MAERISNTTPQLILETTNIVVLAKNFNTSIVSKDWLYNKKIIRERVGNFIHNPVMSIVDTGKFNFMLDENRLQLMLKNINSISMRRLQKVARDFIGNLPETPYTAVGFNYKYHVPKNRFHMAEWFSPNEDKLTEVFSAEHDIGYIISFNFEDFVVRISSPPTSPETDDVILDVNFHGECSSYKEAQQRIDQYLQTYEKIETVISEILKG